MFHKLDENSFGSLYIRIVSHIGNRMISKRVIDAITAGYYESTLYHLVKNYWESDKQYAVFLIVLYRLSKKQSLVVNFPGFSLCIYKGMKTKEINSIARRCWMGD